MGLKDGPTFQKPWSISLKLQASQVNNAEKGKLLFYSDGSIISIPKSTRTSGPSKKKGRYLILIKLMETNGK